MTLTLRHAALAVRAEGSDARLMRYRLLDWLACPEDRHFPLLISDVEEDRPAISKAARAVPCESYCGRWQTSAGVVAANDCAFCDHVQVTRAKIECPGCGARFAVADGIPAMLPWSVTQAVAGAPTVPADRGLRDKVQEMRARDRQAARYDARRVLFHTLAERQALLGRLHVRPGDRVLDGGAGTGHMTLQSLAAGGEVVAVDLSRRSLDVLRARIAGEHSERAHLIQGDLCRLPLRDGIFDKAVQAQVLEHLPTPDDRLLALSETMRVLKPGGAFVLSVYNLSLWKKRAAARGERDSAEREGYHGGEIYYRNFEAAELCSLLETCFRVKRAHGVIVKLPKDLQYRLGRCGLWLERGLQMTPLSRLLGHLLVAECRAAPDGRGDPGVGYPLVGRQRANVSDNRG